jgi:hypothetical protein
VRRMSVDGERRSGEHHQQTQTQDETSHANLSFLKDYVFQNRKTN